MFRHKRAGPALQQVGHVPDVAASGLGIGPRLLDAQAQPIGRGALFYDQPPPRIDGIG